MLSIDFKVIEKSGHQEKITGKIERRRHFFRQMVSWKQCLKSAENSATAMLELILTSSTYQLALTHLKTNWNEGQRSHAEVKHPSQKQKLNHAYGKRLSFSQSHSVLRNQPLYCLQQEFCQSKTCRIPCQDISIKNVNFWQYIRGLD